MVPPRQSSIANRRRYELIRPLGSGGFGTVHLARMVGPGGFETMVAIKILNQEFADHPQLVSRLKDEARILGLVRNQAIVQVHGLLQVQDRWGVVMEYVDGLDLYGILRRIQLPPRPALEIIGHLATALDIAWNSLSPEGEPLHLIHRDVKPSNIKVTTAGEVKILDFGIARAEFDAREAKTHLEAFGTPQYMAPERFELQDGPEGDIYALGVVLFECLTRRVLYERRCFADEERHTDRVVRAQDLAWQATDEVSEELIHFMGDMLAFQPEHRPPAYEVAQRCDALVDELKGARLRAWARASLPPIVDQLSGPPDDSLNGAVLVEEMGELSERPGGQMSYPTPVQVYRPPRRAPRPSPPAPGERLASQTKTEVNLDLQRHPVPRSGTPSKASSRPRGEQKQTRPRTLLLVIAAAILCGLLATWVTQLVTERMLPTPPARAAEPGAEASSGASEVTPTARSASPGDAASQAVAAPPGSAEPTGTTPSSATRSAATGSRPRNTARGADEGATQAPPSPTQVEPDPVWQSAVQVPVSSPKQTLLVVDGQGEVDVTVLVAGVKQSLPISVPEGQYRVTAVWRANQRQDVLLVDALPSGGTVRITCGTRRCSAQKSSR